MLGKIVNNGKSIGEKSEEQDEDDNDTVLSSQV